jgi:hypothetical protein
MSINSICPELADYETVHARLKRHVPAYDKTRLRFADYADRIQVATAHAKRQCGTPGEEHTVNPSTGIWALIEMLTGGSTE